MSTFLNKLYNAENQKEFGCKSYSEPLQLDLHNVKIISEHDN